MKLKTKIMLIFSMTILFCITVAGAFSVLFGTQAINNTQQEKLEISAKLAADDVGNLLKNYLITTVISGQDQIIANEQLPVEYKKKVIDGYVSAYGFTSGNLLDRNGVSLFDGTDFSDREYFQTALAGTPNISEIALSKYTNTYGTSIAAPIVTAENEIIGVIYFRVDINFFTNVLEGLKISDNSVAYIVNKNNQIIAYTDADYVLKDESELVIDNAITGTAIINEEMGLKIKLAAPKSDFAMTLDKMYKALAFCDVIALIFALIIAALFTNYLNKPIVKVKNILSKLSSGDFTISLSTTKRKDEIGILQNTAFDLLNMLKQLIGDTNRILGSIADYDLTAEDMTEYPGEYNQISYSVNRIKEILTYLIVEVQASASNVKIGAKQLADATSLLSAGATTQSSSIDKLMVEIGDVAESINRSSDNGNIIHKQLESLEQEIDEGNAQMNQLNQVVKEIEEMSSDIQKIVGTIDSISFQTNILALNASVEAARAGENGRGFAVVAEEVSALAAKSSEASKRTGELIDKCISGIQDAKRCADQTSASLNNIVADSKKIGVAFVEITNDTHTEAQKANAIKEEINNISAVVQSNSSSTMETAASTEELSSQAVSLEQMIARFRV